jgi:hypothetical protein
MLCSDILRFAEPRLENKVRVNWINLTKGKQNVSNYRGVRVKRVRVKQSKLLQGNWS